MILSSSNRLFLLLSLITALCVKATPRRYILAAKSTLASANDQRIIGGQEIQSEPVPFMVSMSYETEEWCGGSILNERTVLSAAHCYFGIDRNGFLAHVGDNTFQLQKGRILEITAIHFHPQFGERALNNDVALLRLNESLHYDERIQPIALIESDAMLKTGSIVTVYGWGNTGFSNYSEILKFAEFPLIDHELCKRLMVDHGEVTDNMFCAGVLAGGTDSCQGDSGGPVVQSGRVIGIVSWGHYCALPDKAGVYTDVRRMLPWIKETLNREYGESL